MMQPWAVSDLARLRAALVHLDGADAELGDDLPGCEAVWAAQREVTAQLRCIEAQMFTALDGPRR